MLRRVPSIPIQWSALPRPPEKKKAAIGVRGMRLGKKDTIRDVYYLEEEQQKAVEYNGKPLELSHLKISNRDTKGPKIRV